VYFGTGAPLEAGEQVVTLINTDPEVRVAYLRGSHLLRDDLDVPVIIVNSELEAIACYGVRQPDTDGFRYWEIAGTAHTSRQSSRWIAPKTERDFGIVLPANHGANEVSTAPVGDAALRHLRAWVAGGPPPPIQPRIEFAGDPPAVARDGDGIAGGGIRLPQVEVPIACNSAVPRSPDIWSRLAGSCRPFSADEIRRRYPTRADYLARFEDATRAAVQAGVILPRDVEGLLAEASDNFPLDS
jgi:hypothetical protein